MDDSLPSEAPANIMADVKSGMSTISYELLKSKVTESQLIQQSIQEGGPASVHEGITILMDYTNTGIRYLAQRVGQRRKILLGMIEGRITMTPEVLDKIHQVFQEKRPDLFDGKSVAVS